MDKLKANDYLPHDESRAKILHRWAANVIRRWIKEIEYQNITDPDRLEKSLKYKIYNAAGGDMTKIIFTMANYGRYLDVGVGKGEKYKREKHNPIFWSGQKYPETAGYKHQVKPWMYPIFKQRVYALARILERKYSEYAQTIILSNLTAQKTFNNLD